MADSVIEIVNRARGRASLTPLQPAELDSSFEREPLTNRNHFARIYKELVDLKQEDFRTFNTISTVAGVNEYPLLSGSERFENDELYIIQPGTDDETLRYKTEDEILSQFNGDLNDIPSGKPYCFFIRTSSTANQKVLSFVNKPDAVYSIRGYYYQDPAVLTATSLTACNRLGDQFLEDAMYANILFTTGIISYMDMEALIRPARQKYTCQDLKTNTRQGCNSPSQHRG